MTSVDDVLLSPPLMSDAERHRILVQWNDTQREYPKGRCIHEPFEDQADRTPEAVALIHEAQQLTYRELNERSNRLAHCLHSMGVGPEKIVGLCMQRSVDMVVAFLGILKAGGVYLPIDPAYPAERTRYMLADAKPILVLAQTLAEDAVPVGGETNVRTVNELWEQARTHPCSNLPLSVTGLRPQHLAYIVFTSGSTGQPKGVMVEHEATVNGLSGQAQFTPFQSTDVCCQKSSIGFVDSIFEILGPLLAGAALIVVPSMVSRDSSQLAAFIAAKAITRIVSVPSLAQALIEQPQSAEDLAPLRSWLLSGEALGAHLLSRLHRELPNCNFTNIYGSSEVAAFVTGYMSERNVVQESSVSIGCPQQNVRIYVLDDTLRPVPIGAVGEIYVAGVSLARGYLQRPQQTAERFITDPHAAAVGARMYRTGDLGRWRADGMIEYVGRSDHQVKLRGYRIELGEIEAALRGYAPVRRAAAVLREDQPGDKRLVAYVECAPGERASPKELRTYLSTRLPHYMVPSIVVLLDELPLNAHGKIDRRRLPEPDRHLQAPDFVPPTSQTEQLLASIWSEVLQLDCVGSNSDFFELGGHSLLAAPLMSKIKERFGVTVTLPALFAAPTVKTLANYIELLLLVSELRRAEGGEYGERSEPAPAAPGGGAAHGAIST